jgi:ERCC4-related helicase
LIITTSIMLQGLDKCDPDIVILLRPFTHLCSIVQAAGRGGRRRIDGMRKLVPVYLLYNNTDIRPNSKLVSNAAKQFYLDSVSCNKSLLHEHFKYCKKETFISLNNLCCNVHNVLK